MKKNIFILWGMCLLFLAGTLRAQEVVKRDTVITTNESSKEQPTDDRYRVVTNRFWANWFVTAGFGGSYYTADFPEVGNFKDRLSPHFYMGVGKWFTPGLGIKLQMQGFRAKGFSDQYNMYSYGDPFMVGDGEYYKTRMKFWDLTVQGMANITSLLGGYKPDRRHHVIFSLGFGWVNQWGMNYDQSHTYSGNMELQYSYFLGKGFSIDAKLWAQGMETCFDDIYTDRNGKADMWDACFGVGVGLTYYIKKRGWDRCNSCPQDIVYINNQINELRADCPKTKTGILEFYVFYPNNYSGCNDAPTVAGAQVNAIDYLVSGIYTQKRFRDTDAVNGVLGNDRALSDLRTDDIATVNAAQLDDSMFRGYEMASAPLNRNMTAEEMKAFKDKEGYYYAPIYSEVTGNPGEINKWGYRIDPSTAGQRLANKKENYDDVQSYQLNAHQGLEIVKKYATEEDVPVTLCSLADFYAAVSGNTGYIRQFTDSAMVNKINGILNGDNIVLVEVSGLATSQDNNRKVEIGVERNERLATDRATSVMNWMKQMNCFRDDDNKFIMQKGSNLVKKVKDKNVNSLDSKLNRSARVRIIYTHTR